MTTSTATEAAQRLPGQAWMRALRSAAAGRAAATGLPTDDEEVWRYSPINGINLSAYARTSSAPTGRFDLPEPLVSILAAIPERAALVVTRNGWVTTVEGGGPVSVLSDTGDDPGVGSIVGQGDVFSDLSLASTPSGVLVDVPAGAVVENPIIIVNWIDDDSTVTGLRTYVRVGEGAEVRVVEMLGGPGVSSLVLPVVEVEVGQGANVGYVNVQALGHRVWQLGHQVSRVGGDATFTSFTAAVGGGYARVRTDSSLVGRGGTANLLAAYFGDGDQVHDFRTQQDHVAPKTTSDLLFKGAVEDTAHGIYTGLIRVRNGASGTNAFQTNRNLVLSEGAHADSVPNLAIEENDVRCSHASAVGPIDAEQRWYLEGRGVPPEVADRLIVLGFFDDIFERLPVAGLRGALRDLVAAKLTSAHGVDRPGSRS